MPYTSHAAPPAQGLVGGGGDAGGEAAGGEAAGGDAGGPGSGGGGGPGSGGGGGGGGGGGAETDVSATATVALVATTVPVVDPVRKLARKDSAPSVVVSLLKTTAKEPELLVIVTEPPAVTALAGELKSALLMVPDTPSSAQ